MGVGYGCTESKIGFWTIHVPYVSQNILGRFSKNQIITDSYRKQKRGLMTPFHILKQNYFFPFLAAFFTGLATFLAGFAAGFAAFFAGFAFFGSSLTSIALSNNLDELMLNT